MFVVLIIAAAERYQGWWWFFLVTERWLAPMKMITKWSFSWSSWVCYFFLFCHFLDYSFTITSTVWTMGQWWYE